MFKFDTRIIWPLGNIVDVPVSYCITLAFYTASFVPGHLSTGLVTEGALQSNQGRETGASL